MNQETIGKNIRKARRDLDMTQDALAERLAVTESAVSQWESGKTVPDLMTVPALCTVLGVTSDWLLGVDAEKRREEIAAIEERAAALSRVGHREEGAAILREGLKKYPESERLLWLLMYDSDDQEEVIRIGEIIEERERMIRRLFEGMERLFSVPAPRRIERKNDPRLLHPGVAEPAVPVLVHQLIKPDPARRRRLFVNALVQCEVEIFQELLPVAGRRRPVVFPALLRIKIEKQALAVHRVRGEH
ncbi:MAG: helix-turn-helix transcriptional regulator, partial [Clostridia bacterium]|nr:helix-turn-helix transcriptional regulator [Clostridia bacterium]